MEQNESLCIIEVKSTTPSNFTTQGEKGIVQLLRYRMSFRANNHKTGKYILLIEEAEGSAVSYLQDLSHEVGIDTILYDRAGSWRDTLAIKVEL